MKKILVKFYWDCGRMGSLDGLFVCTEKELNEAFGQRLYFGEVLGKHSEIYGTFEKKDATIVSDEDDKITWLLTVMDREDTISGYNPLKYLPEIELEDEDEDD